MTDVIEEINSHFLYRIINPFALTSIIILNSSEIIVASKKEAIPFELGDIKDIRINSHLFFVDIELTDKSGKKIVLPYMSKRKTKMVNDWR